MSADTLLFLRSLLLGVTLSVGATDFREVSAKVVAALDELDAALAAEAK
jgi:hypothetical protein